MTYRSIHYRKKEDDFYYNLFFKKGMEILDVGCSSGQFILQDKKNIFGIDVDKDALKIAKQRKLKVKYCDLEKDKIPFNNNTFDAVNCRNVIEHLYKPLSLLKEIRRVLKPDGKAVIITPDLRHDKFKFWHGYDHVHPFIKESLQKIIFDAGFSKFKIYNIPNGIPGFGMLYRMNLLKEHQVLNIMKLAGKIKGNFLVAEAYK